MQAKTYVMRQSSDNTLQRLGKMFFTEFTIILNELKPLINLADLSTLNVLKTFEIDSNLSCTSRYISKTPTSPIITIRTSRKLQL